MYIASGLPNDLSDATRAREELDRWIGDDGIVVAGQNMVRMPAVDGMRVTILVVGAVEYASVSSRLAR